MLNVHDQACGTCGGAQRAANKKKKTCQERRTAPKEHAWSTHACVFITAHSGSQSNTSAHSAVMQTLQRTAAAMQDHAKGQAFDNPGPTPPRLQASYLAVQPTLHASGARAASLAATCESTLANIPLPAPNAPPYVPKAIQSGETAQSSTCLRRPSRSPSNHRTCQAWLYRDGGWL